MGGPTQVSLKTNFHGEHCCLTAQLSCHTSKSVSANMPKPHFPELPVSAEPSRVPGARDSCPTQDFSKEQFLLGDPTLAWPRFSPNCAAIWCSSYPTLPSFSPCQILPHSLLSFSGISPKKPLFLVCLFLSCHLLLGRTELAVKYWEYNWRKIIPALRA